MKKQLSPEAQALKDKMSPETQAWIEDRLIELDTEPKSITIAADEVPGVFAALCAMVLDVHAPQDQLTEGEFSKAEEVYKRFEAEMNRRFALLKTG
jgi:hypothetical protein